MEIHSAGAQAEVASRVLAGMQKLFPFDGGSVQDDRGGIRNIPWLQGDKILWQSAAPTGDPANRGLRMMAPWGPNFLPLREAFFEVSADRHPHTDYFRSTGDGAARRLSEIVSTQQLRRTRFFNEISRPHGFTSQLTIFIPLAPTGLLIVAAARQKINFSNREAALFNLLRPHIAMAWKRAMRTNISHPKAQLGLTAREGEILHWLAQGKRNSEIAIICRLATATVETHLKNIFAKLGVETRTAAAAMAWEALPRPS